MDILDKLEFSDPPKTPAEAGGQSSAYLYRLRRLDRGVATIKDAEARRYRYELDTNSFATLRYENALNAVKLLDIIAQSDDLKVQQESYGHFLDLEAKISDEFGTGPVPPQDMLEDVLGIYLYQDLYGEDSFKRELKRNVRNYISHLMSYALEEPTFTKDSQLKPREAHEYILQSNLNDSNLFAYLHYETDPSTTHDQLLEQHDAIVRKDDDRIFMYEDISETFWKNAELTLQTYIELVNRRTGEKVSENAAILLSATILDTYRDWSVKELDSARKKLTFEMPKPPMSEEVIVEAVAKAIKDVERCAKKHTKENLGLLQEDAYKEATNSGIKITLQ